MGARFDISHINLVGYLTDETGAPAPRVDRETLGTFLMSLAYNGNLISSTQGTPVDWTAEVANAASQQFRELDFQFDDLRNLQPVDPRKYIDPLRTYFIGYDFYALILPENDWRLDERSLQFFMEAGISSGAKGLVLLPHQRFGGGLSQFVDPFPALRELARQPIAPPGVLFWTRLGSACALGLDDALRFLRHDLLDALAGGLRATDDAILRQASRQSTKRILHLSDLHIGLEEATLRRSYLKRHLRGVLPTVDRVAVTGDLFDTPSEGLRASFDEFRRDVEDSTTKRLLVVPGNHDVRVKGNALGRIGRAAEYVTDLDWSPIEVDDDIQAVFYSFNSSESGDFARGCVSKRQRLDRAERFEDAVARDNHVGSYFNIALVHHHPVSYGSQPTALYERLLARFGGDERFIAFEGAEEFLSWCMGRNVGLVLHGHKHIPHLSTVRPTADAEVTVVGCGSSVGAEGKPMCYDVVSIDPATKRWSVSFHHDERGDGSGFRLQNVALDLRTPS
ncbi:metallophosphoesterase family protein [Allomesorhizobium camelthorni]|uniref:Metallophosphoesterase n=1 Tax=Allomesorhizobium camelthorni TaxID=475069 RepID=A0A6G4WGL7_9HYPH|nr:metallophosphoesterase [Mesorhizobium camelthorni]NGO53901.1 metallophosphoesterase [Mesorhizobium camelthorni]